MNPKTLNRILKVIFAAVFAAAVWGVSFNAPPGDGVYDRGVCGRDIIKSFSLTEKDGASFAERGERNNSSWLFDAFTYSMMSLSGSIYILRAVRFIVLFITAFILFLILYKRQQGKYLSVVLPPVVAGFFLMAPYAEYGPQLFVFLFIACFLYVLERRPAKRNKNLFYMLPFISLLWANIHFSAMTGTLLMLVYLVYDFIDTREVEEKKENYDFRLYLTSFVGVVVFSFVNPLLYNSHAGFIREVAGGGWLSGHVYTKPSLYFISFYAYTAVAAAVLLYNLKGVNVGRKAEFFKDLILTIIFMAAAFKNAEFIPYFLIVSIPVIAYYSCLIFRWGLVWPKQWTERDLSVIKNYIYFIMIPLLAVFTALSFIAEKKETYPVGAVNYIVENNVPRNVFSEIKIGAYLYYHLYPEYRVFGLKGESYSPDFEIAEEEIKDGDTGFEKHLEKYGINSLVIKENSGVIPKLEKFGFAPAYFGGGFIIFVNKDKTDRYFRHIRPYGKKHYGEKNFEAALAELEEFTENNPSQEAQLMLAKMYAKKNIPDAVSYLEYMIEQYPEHYSLYNYLGELLYGTGDYENAVEILDASKTGDKKKLKLINSAKEKIE